MAGDDAQFIPGLIEMESHDEVLVFVGKHGFDAVGGHDIKAFLFAQFTATVGIAIFKKFQIIFFAAIGVISEFPLAE